ncbi:MAG: acetate--CoA ligase family protein [Candidatus Nanopelagicales bacterium]
MTWSSGSYDDALAALWSARSIAVVGATERVGAMGRLPIDYLLKYGYTGQIAPVNPKGGTVLGLPVFTDVREAAANVDGAIDLALIMVPAAAVDQAVTDCASAGVRVCVVMSSGFGEVDEAGRQRQDALVAIARAAGMRLVGPNCIGSVGGADSVLATFSPVFSSPSTPLPSGPLALVSQSGALGFGALSLGLERDVPIGIAVTTGNEADVTAEEVAASLARDDTVHGVLLYLESVADVAMLGQTSALVPTVAVKAGRSEAGARAAASHTGALTSGDDVVDAALARAGVARVATIDHLLDAGALIATGARLDAPLDRRVGGGVITTSGGSGILAADAIEAEGLTLSTLDTATITAIEQVIPAYGSAVNPVDVTAAVMAESGLFETCVHQLAADPAVDAIVACFAVLVGDDVLRIARALGEVRAKTNKPVVAARTGAANLAPEGARLLADQGVPVYPTPERAVAAVRALRDACRGPLRIEPHVGGAAGSTQSVSEPAINATEDQLKAMFAAAGLPIPAARLVADTTDAAAAVSEMGGRAVFKAVVPGLLHKSDAGGVIVDVDVDAAPAAFAQCAALGGQVLVEQFVPGGVEVLVGITPSPMGRVLTIGVGGVLTELVADVAVALLPVSEHDIDALLDQTRVGRLLAGVRGAPAADRAALVRTIARLIEITEGWSQDMEIELNPVTVLPRDCWILDAVVHRRTDEGNGNN